jgi:hypothetical protein
VAVSNRVFHHPARRCSHYTWAHHRCTRCLLMPALHLQASAWYVISIVTGTTCSKEVDAGCRVVVGVQNVLATGLAMQEEYTTEGRQGRRSNLHVGTKVRLARSAPSPNAYRRLFFFPALPCISGTGTETSTLTAAGIMRLSCNQAQVLLVPRQGSPCSAGGSLSHNSIRRQTRQLLWPSQRAAQGLSPGAHPLPPCCHPCAALQRYGTTTTAIATTTTTTWGSTVAQSAPLPPLPHALLPPACP